MAKENATEDLDLGEEKKGKSKLIIIIAAVVLLLVGGGLAAYFLLFAGDEQTQEIAGQEAAAPAEAASKGPAIYLALDPPFVVTLPGHPRLLQVGVSVRVSSEQIGEFVSHNDPMIRHNLLNLLSTVDATALKARSAKVGLQKRMLDELNRILKELQAPGQVDALYFTSFVMQ